MLTTVQNYILLTHQKQDLNQLWRILTTVNIFQNCKEQLRQISPSVKVEFVAEEELDAHGALVEAGMAENEAVLQEDNNLLENSHVCIRSIN